MNHINYAYEYSSNAHNSIHWNSLFTILNDDEYRTQT